MVEIHICIMVGISLDMYNGFMAWLVINYAPLSCFAPLVPSVPFLPLSYQLVPFFSYNTPVFYQQLVFL